MEKSRIAVIGAGLMGHGIAYLFGAGGHAVRVQDPASDALESCRTRIPFSTRLSRRANSA